MTNEDATAPQHSPKSNPWAALWTLVLGFFMILVDTTIVSVANPSIMGALDTTMTFTDFTEGLAPFPVALRPRLVELQDRILLGSDFPNIPHRYVHQLEALVRLELGDGWLRDVLHDNAARRFGLDATA